MAMVLAQQSNANETPEVKQEATSGIKREANGEAYKTYTDGEVAVVSNKRLKCLPTSKDEVIELD